MTISIRSVRAAVLSSPHLFRHDMYQWLLNAENVSVWRAFETQANQIWVMGRAHYSARTIGEYIRHNTHLHDAGADFKVNDHIWPDLARLWTALYPDRRGFFEFRSRAAA